MRLASVSARGRFLPYSGRTRWWRVRSRRWLGQYAVRTAGDWLIPPLITNLAALAGPGAGISHLQAQLTKAATPAPHP